ncbi:MAG: hypothetical protein SPG61_01560, partial [Arcanobacterium sp.]|nr:hypothetical protein [Arcanobacterium sp.]
YAFVALMQHFLGKHFDSEQFSLICKVNLEQYYVLMVAAWYLATAAEKQPEATHPLLLTGKINTAENGGEELVIPAKLWRKAIQKTLESRRIESGFKEELKTVRNSIPKN